MILFGFGVECLNSLLATFTFCFRKFALHRAIENIATCFIRLEQVRRGRERRRGKSERETDLKKEVLRENAKKKKGGVTVSSNPKFPCYHFCYIPLIISLVQSIPREGDVYEGMNIKMEGTKSF